MQPQNSQLAPIVLFVYARPIHTSRTIAALLENELANQSDLIIYSDSHKTTEDIENVAEVRRLIKEIKGFNSITIIEREKNYGLAQNIIDGVTYICEKYGRVIVMEDDLLTSPYFLKYMNDALSYYENSQKIWHISGWNYPINPKGLPDVFLWPVMNCWGWATWQDRWVNFNKDPNKIVGSWSGDRIKRFNMNGSYDFWSQIIENHKGTLNTWAIFWYATIFENNGLCLNPTISYVENIGLDGTGTNCKAKRPGIKLNLNNTLIEKWPSPKTNSDEAIRRIVSYNNQNHYWRFINSLFRKITK